MACWRRPVATDLCALLAGCWSGRTLDVVSLFTLMHLREVFAGYLL
jgi:hypothetical protein